MFFSRSRLSSPSLTMSPTLESVLLSPSGRTKRDPVPIPPPVLRPQHVYPPVAPLGMLSLGVLSKHKDEGGGGLHDRPTSSMFGNVVGGGGTGGEGGFKGFAGGELECRDNDASVLIT